MRAVVQRVKHARVLVQEKIVGEIATGLLVLLGVEQGDEKSDADFLAKKISELRIFEDDQGKMNRSLLDCNGEMLVVSQFTLLGDCRKGRRPSFAQAADPELGEALYEYFVESVEQLGVTTATGQFRAQMEVELINNGPVTLLLDSKKLF